MCSALLTRCRKLPDHFGSLWCHMVHCSKMPKCCGRLAGHCGACSALRYTPKMLWKGCRPLRCIAYVVEGLWTVVCSSELRCIVYCTDNTEHTRPHHASLRGARFTATVIPICTHTHVPCHLTHVISRHVLCYLMPRACHLTPCAIPSHATYYAISRHVPRRFMPRTTQSHPMGHAISRQVPRHVPRHLTHAILMPHATPSHATCHAISDTSSHATCHAISCMPFSCQVP